MKKIVLIFVLNFLLVGNSVANQKKQFIISATIVKHGLYETVVLEKQPYPDLPYAAYEEMSTVRHMRTTDTIKGEIGVAFGLSYVLHETPQNPSMDGERLITIKTVVIYPKPGILDLENNKIHAQSITYRDVPINAEVYEGYYLGSDQDIVEGEWIFQLWYQDDQLAEKRFQVMKGK